jgi:hypothetical protein
MDREQASQLCFGSGLDPDPDWIGIQMGQRIRIGNLDTDRESGSGSRYANKIVPHERKILSNFILKSSLLGWRLLLEPECPLKGFKKTYMTVLIFLQKPWSASGSGLDSDSATTWMRYQLKWLDPDAGFSESGSETFAHGNER